MNLEVPHESVLLLDLSHPVAELGADGPDGGVQLLHACSVRLVLRCRKLLLYIIFLQATKDGATNFMVLVHNALS